MPKQKKIFKVGGYRHKPWPSLEDYLNDRLVKEISQPAIISKNIDWSKLGMSLEDVNKAFQDMCEASKKFVRNAGYFVPPVLDNSIIISDPGDEQLGYSIISNHG